MAHYIYFFKIKALEWPVTVTSVTQVNHVVNLDLLYGKTRLTTRCGGGLYRPVVRGLSGWDADSSSAPL